MGGAALVALFAGTKLAAAVIAVRCSASDNSNDAGLPGEA
jgi:hypothetical protein